MELRKILKFSDLRSGGAAYRIRGAAIGIIIASPMPFDGVVVQNRLDHEESICENKIE